jgi:hypothetical protein
MQASLPRMVKRGPASRAVCGDRIQGSQGSELGPKREREENEATKTLENQNIAIQGIEPWAIA